MLPSKCCPARDCARCRSISCSNPSKSTSKPCSRAISAVNSGGKPYVSYSTNISLPEMVPAWEGGSTDGLLRKLPPRLGEPAVALPWREIISSRISLPRPKASANRSSSRLTTRRMNSRFRESSLYTPWKRGMTSSSTSTRKGPVSPRRRP